MEFLSKIYYGNSVEKWIIAFVIIIGFVILGKIVYYVFSNIIKAAASKTKTRLDDILVDMIEEPAMLAIILVGFSYSLKILSLSGSIETWVYNIYHVLIVLNVTWLISRLFQSIFEEYIMPIADKSDSDFDDQLLPIVKKSVAIAIWTLGIIIALDNAGYNIGALLAGLGIGGLLLAMAAKDTVANIFGGLTIFLDKPFMIKDRIKISGFDGTITEIGIRSTKMKTLSGTNVTIPNAVFSDSPVENVSREPSRKIVLNLGLTYDTTPKEIEKAQELLKDIAHKNKGVNEDFKVGFNSFGDFSLGIIFIYYIKKSADILETQNQINLEILKEFNKHKLNMAFPTQTIELHKK